MCKAFRAESVRQLLPTERTKTLGETLQMLVRGRSRPLVKDKDDDGNEILQDRPKGRCFAAVINFLKQIVHSTNGMTTPSKTVQYIFFL